MPTLDEYATQPRAPRLARTADELATAVAGQSDASLSRRPDATSWAPKEVICHLRDAEETFAARFEQILAMDVAPRLGLADPGIHPVHGRITLDGFLAFMAWHDDNHLDQLTRALQGRA